jgi:fructoselysine-6-P-deglycase FrlB-like protein
MGVLPQDGERVAVIGCGTSFFIAQAYAALREASGRGESDAFPASEFPLARRYDRVVALTRSGTTTEVLAALGGLRPGTPTLALTAADDGPIADAVDELIVLEFANERSIVQTRFATSVLMLLRAHLGDDAEGIVEAARRAVFEPLPEGSLECSQFTFLGSKWTVGLANEAALKLREAAGVWSEAYPAMEYRHGPISVTAPRSLVWVFGNPPKGLAEDVAATGGHFETSIEDPLADLVRAQRLAVALAADRGLDPDRPRHLTRSVILDSPTARAEG